MPEKRVSRVKPAKKDGAALLESERKLKILFEMLPIGISILDAERKIVYSNPALDTILDIPRERLLRGDYVRRTYLRPDRTPMLRKEFASVRAIKEHRRICDVETGIKKEDGEVIWTNVSAVPVAFKEWKVVIITSDITERKRAEEALRESEVRYRELFENMNSGVAVYTVIGDGQDFIFKDYNRAGENIDHDRRERLIGKSIFEVRPGVEQFGLIEVFRRVWRTGKPAYHPVTLYQDEKLSGWYENHVYKLPSGEIVTFFEDVTERKRAEEELRKSDSHLRAMALELSSTEERERRRLALFLHDEIGQSLALLQMKLGGLAGAWRSKSGKQSIRQIRDLLEKVIDQAHALTFEMSPPILHQLGLEAAVEWAGEKISQDHGLDFTLNDDGMNKSLDADLKTLLFTCVRELMLNTVKHAKAKRLSVKIAREGEKILMTIIDDGIGFDPSLLENHPAQVGFGLFSVRERLAAMGGTFELRSEPGRGTRITLSVPLKEEIPSS